MNFGHLSKYRSELMGVFCIWIMLHHSKDVITYPSWLEPLREFFVRGNVGVDAFLILSGVGLYFAYSKLKTAEPRTGRRLWQFYVRRFVRLFIPYLLLAAPYFAWVAWSRGAGVKRFMLDFSQASLLLHGEKVLWYVAALSVFYLLFPLFYNLMYAPRSFRGKPVSSGSVMFGLYFLSAVSCWLVMRCAPVFYKNCEIMLTRLPVFIVGCGLGKWVKEKRPIPSSAATGSLVFMLIYIFIMWDDVKTVKLWVRLSEAPFAIAALIFFAWVFYKLDGCAKTRRFFAFCGERSLELYLTHVMARRVWQYYLPNDLWDPWGALSYLCILAASFAVSIILHPLIGWLSKKLLSIGGTPKVNA